MPSEDNRFTARAARYARVGANVGGVAARMAGARLLGGNDEAANAAALGKALGGLKGPIMKMAQLFATIPDALPPEYAEALQKLQSDAPPMGAAFVKRRMQAELGPEWQSRFGSFDLQPAAAASLGQVHRAATHTGQPLACKLQYPDMASAVEADIRQLDMLFSVHRRMSPAVDTREIIKEVSERVREELHYRQEAQHTALYRLMLADVPEVRVPDVLDELSTDRLLTMSWLEGRKLLDFKTETLAVRNQIAVAMFKAWWVPFTRYGVIHGDPHLGNYAVREENGAVAGVNLLDFGCIRVFPPAFVGGVVDLYQGLLQGDEARVARAYDAWGFRGLKPELIDTLNLWAKFIYGPILDDRVRTVGDGIEPGKYGRREAFEVHKILKEKGPILIPREFVFMDRAAVGLGSVFLHLNAEMNFARLFQDMIADFDVAAVTERQREALARVGLKPVVHDVTAGTASL
ncbi:AarF/ABC1/UbiB kinase family protein [Lichenihabitans sp. Uapishka_5]|uniref:ABC1 kinase family protein n=1 Tax=Lichenihabitans sp. Uapishka_5 TaxID=3037302 RepID=UPI0029E7F87A|nr:AarF/ABC1/UbiB kinase family protein [Lichenihabitans sp. Uapishka_5]MDX7949967.1 AarF/ABC1/UbiB kinase family protein [Lichenihabitans sp. Uapishka_5]